MAELALDVVEQILVQLDVEDLIRCKSVCKSWKSLISDPRFVKAHLDHAYMIDCNNHELGYRRICLSSIFGEETWFDCDLINIVGSCNGLVCVSPRGVNFVLTNPSTREHARLPTPSFEPHMQEFQIIRDFVCWGFGYDSSTDDYKVIVGFMKNTYLEPTCFHEFTLKSNTWKVIGQVKYCCYGGRSGILFDGALHWFMTDKSNKKVVISLDLSTNEFRTILLPNRLYNYDLFEHSLGVIKECLCIYSTCGAPSTKKWVMKNNKWELYIDDHCQSKYDVAHCLTNEQYMSSDVYSVDNGKRVPSNGAYIRTSIFVKSLVSPRPSFNNLYQGMPSRGRSCKSRIGGKRNRSCNHKKRVLCELVLYK